MAGLDIVEDADRYAYRQGLFVLGIDYTKNVPSPNLRPADIAWLKERIREHI